MKTAVVCAVAAMLSFGCSSSSSQSSADPPVIDELDVPTMTSLMTVGDSTGPGIVATVTAHDTNSGIATLHVAFPDSGTDDAIAVPMTPMTLMAKQVSIVFIGKTSGDHQVQFRLTNADGEDSAVVTKTITVITD